MGNVILAFCHVGACAVIGKNNFFSAYTNIEHHCNIGDHNSYGPVISFSACVTVGDRVRLGTGIFVEPYLSIGNDCIISSGSVITRNISDECKVKVKSNLSIN